MIPRRFLVTGGNGFVGSALVNELRTRPGLIVRQAIRSNMSSSCGPHEDCAVVGDIHGATDWQAALEGVEVVIHTAARVHVMKDPSAQPLSEFRRVNVEGTMALAKQAAAAGVRRFVFVSSVKVNGERTLPGHSFGPDDPANPLDPYGQSKHEAEMALLMLARDTGMEVVVVRPPLVYGPGVRGNFLALLRAVHQGRPLPVASIRNARSLVYIHNLVDFLVHCATHSAAAGQTFLVSDGQDLSTPELIGHLSQAMKRRARLFPMPLWLMQIAATSIGKEAAYQRLTSNLQVDISKARDLLGWLPPVPVEAGLQRTAEGFLSDIQRMKDHGPAVPAS
jgi:nucleoside-diphosphate-sugar epimerase